MPSFIFKRNQKGMERVVVVDVCHERSRNRKESVVKAISSLLPELENPNLNELELESFLTTPPPFFFFQTT